MKLNKLTACILAASVLPAAQSVTAQEVLEEVIATGEVSDVVFGLPSHADGNLTKIGDKVIKIIALSKN